MPLQARTIPADAPDAAAIIDAMTAEVSALYGGDMSGPGTPSATPQDFAPPAGRFVVLYDGDGRPVAGGGVKTLAPGLGEIKRMYVVPEARGRGVARELLVALEEAARELGYERVRLDTGPKQPHAERLYRSAGYEEIGNFNANRMASFWGEKKLR